MVFRGSAHPEAAWAFIEYLSDSTRQARFYALTGDLPSRRSAWRDSALAGDPYARAFRRQLQFVRATPKIPEWDEITTLITDHSEAAVRGGTPPDSALAALDRDVDQALEKRRWLQRREQSHDQAQDRAQDRAQDQAQDRVHEQPRKQAPEHANVRDSGASTGAE